MGFNEKVHAFIAAKFHFYLTETFGERGKKAFIHATQYYAGQRGRRMAQRAIRDGYDLTYETYLQYGEWMPTGEIKDDEVHVVDVKTINPDYEIHTFCCPWHVQFKEMGLLEAGRDYCNHLDSSICRGFNPLIDFEVVQTLFTGDCCVHIIKGANFDEDTAPQKKVEYTQGFEYHCAHSYWAYNEVTGAIFMEKGEEIGAKVLKDFADTYGPEMANKIAGCKHKNFNITS